MAGNFKVGMTLTAKDEASQVLEKGKKKVVKATEGVEKATKKAGQEQKRTDDESINSTKRVVTELQRAARARETLGIRSEHEIRRKSPLLKPVITALPVVASCLPANRRGHGVPRKSKSGN